VLTCRSSKLAHQMHGPDDEAERKSHICITKIQLYLLCFTELNPNKESLEKHGPLPNSFSMFPAKRPDPDIVFSYNLVMVTDSYIDSFSSHIVCLLVEAQAYCSLQLRRSKHHSTTLLY
jgi:hypothetical protein